MVPTNVILLLYYSTLRLPFINLGFERQIQNAKIVKKIVLTNVTLRLPFINLGFEHRIQSAEIV